jgi:hypothetical protein
VRRLLWESLEVFAVRREQSACALVALAESLRKEAGPGADFGRLYDLCAEAAPEAFTRVWSDPSACAWVRTVFDLVTQSRGAAPTARGEAAARSYGADGPEAALAAHLSGFARFAVAVAWLEGRRFALERPLRVSLPWALPGTPLSIAGEVELELASLEGVSLEEAPVVRAQGCALRLQPQALAALPGFDALGPALAAGPGLQREAAPHLAAALDLLARHAPAALDVLRGHTSVVAFQPLAGGELGGGTHPDLPGAMLVPLLREPFELAEALVGEVQADRLFHLEDLEPIFTDPERGAADLRATCARAAAARFWRDALRAGDARA